MTTITLTRAEWQLIVEALNGDRPYPSEAKRELSEKIARQMLPAAS